MLNDMSRLSQSTPLDTRICGVTGVARTFTRTRSSGTRLSQASGSSAMPLVQKATASSPRATRPSPASSGVKRWLKSACTAAISAPTSRRTTCGRVLRPAGGRKASGEGKPTTGTGNSCGP
ncbi:MAG: hypothetical protein M5U28_20335 [Sandaracinaceae bacterium]|nr:hypothetical protein [Sandaracinaceae bacterium]